MFDINQELSVVNPDLEAIIIKSVEAQKVPMSVYVLRHGIMTWNRTAGKDVRNDN
jgi:hypothetical protein